MNGNQATADHRKLIINWVGILGVIAFASGTLLTFKGYTAELLIGAGVGAISGLVGFLSAGKSTPAQPDITVSGQPPKVELSHPEQQQEPQNQ